MFSSEMFFILLTILMFALMVEKQWWLNCSSSHCILSSLPHSQFKKIKASKNVNFTKSCLLSAHLANNILYDELGCVYLALLQTSSVSTQGKALVQLLSCKLN